MKNGSVIIGEHILTPPGNNETLPQRSARFESNGITPPSFGEHKFFSNQKYGRISIFVYDVYRTFLLIVCRSQRKAYYLGNSLRGILSTIFGNIPIEKNYNFLLELNKRPTGEMMTFDIANLIQPMPQEDIYENFDFVVEIISGSGLKYTELKDACEILGIAINMPNVLYALQLLEYSNSLIYSFMTGSYYEAHYRHDRKAASRYNLDKSYLENRFAYDTAFLTAFRGIEALLQKPYFRNHEINSLLSKLDSRAKTDFSSKKYKSFHEIFSSRKKYWSYEDIISHYLKLRNAVAAHGNINPPDIIMEDQVFEIQFLLRNMFMKIIRSNK